MTKQLTQLPQTQEYETAKAIYFASCRVHDEGFWVPKSLIISQWETPEGDVVEQDHNRAINFVQYVPTWFIAKNGLWGKLQGSRGF